MTWRDRARPLIAQVLRETAGKAEAEIKKALFDAYPFGPRQYHPYAVWLDEIKRQRKVARPKPLSKEAKKRIAEYEARTGKPWPTTGNLLEGL